MGSRAKVEIVSDSLTVKVIGPASADKAVTLCVAVVPSSSEVCPTTDAQVLTIGGAAYAQHSVYIGVQDVPLRFAAEASHLIKPRPLIGSLPKVVYTFNLIGGDRDSSI